MKILQINKFYYYRDGTSRYFLNLSDLMTKNGHRIYSFSMHHPHNKYSNQSSNFVSNISFGKDNYINPIKVVQRMFFSSEARRKMKLLLDTYKVDIAHIHNIYHHISPSILIELKKRKIPIVMNVGDYHLISPCYNLFHNGKICEATKPNKYYKALFHRYVNNSFLATMAEVVEKYFHKILINEENIIDLFITPTKFMKKKLIEYKFSENKVTVLPHFINYKKYLPQYNPGDYIIYFGGLYEHKGLNLLLEVINDLPLITFYIVGTGTLKEELMTRIIKNKIKNVKLLGYLKDTRLKNLIMNSRFTIVPSIWYEGFGLVILEAYACGKPVIASRIGGIPEVIKDGKSGLLFEPGNIDDCKNKILKLWNNPKLVSKMGIYARKLVETNFNPEDHYQKIMKIYKMAIKNNKLRT